ncbi:DUF1800 domain-containing protein [Variovorax terrae]|uniref:DUF1800 domain-containing protein n=1 Tax=Variovorax terrae TaxID=2923278 RepID=A0A9X1VYG9_9BURK|nr:DUF1800 domain-containing protein [Variovorax terrae]MCJ0764489.1 DUF1800 domain-containing protein [Variovorax terrae]
MTASSATKTAAVALNRFGLGVRADESLPTDPKGWLLAQFDRYAPLPPAWAGQPDSASRVTEYVDYQRALRQADATNELAMRQKLRNQTQARYRSAVNARVASALATPAPFAERLVHFWANHFAVSIDKAPIAALAGTFELEAIRPHIFGRFEDMLAAVEHHPAMLFYLDQARSIGPDSMVAQRAARLNPERQRGLNENLAREILELHTLGVRSGYSQGDVTEFARALTGWSIGGLPGLPPGGAPGTFAFQPMLHEPGPRTVLGQRYEQRGEAQARAILRDLAASPATAQHIADKLARHFVGDAPPPALVERLASTFLQSRGDLPSVYRALIGAPEAWSLAQTKFKTPWEWTLSSLRGLGWRDLGDQQLAPVLVQLGQPVWRPGSPAGYDDITESWAAPDMLMRRVELAQRFAAQAASTVDARLLGPQLLPAGLSPATASALARAESPATALALLLASPEFLRR